eukprot:4648894-Prymnesium_polylepis.1
MAHNGFACDVPVLYWNLQRRGTDAYGWLKKVGIGSWFDSLEFARLVGYAERGRATVWRSCIVRRWIARAVG